MKAKPFGSRYTVDVNGCWVWNDAVFKQTGYGAITIGRKTFVTHRVSYELHKGSIPDGVQVLHKCDNKRCVNPDHLFLGSQLDNMRDMAAKGRTPTKLDVATVLAIRSDVRPQRVVAVEYGISQSSVWRIRNDRTWFHI